MTPYPGTEFYKQLQQERKLKVDKLNDIDGFRTAAIRTDALSTEDLETALVEANETWMRHCRERSKKNNFISQKGTLEDKISIVIPTYNPMPFLTECLSSLFSQSFKNIEVILVDDGSSDNSAKWVREHYPKVQVIDNRERKGFVESVNEGLKYTTGEYVVFLNVDTEVETNWLESLLYAFKQYPEVGFCASKILSYSQRNIIDSAGDGITRGGYAFQIGHGQPDNEHYQLPRKVFGASACASIYRKNVILESLLQNLNF